MKTANDLFNEWKRTYWAFSQCPAMDHKTRFILGMAQHLAWLRYVEASGVTRLPYEQAREQSGILSE